MSHAALLFVLGLCAFASGFGLRIVDPLMPLLAASRQPGAMKLSGAITAATRSEPGLGCAVAMLLSMRVSNPTKKTHTDEPAL